MAFRAAVVRTLLGSGAGWFDVRLPRLGARLWPGRSPARGCSCCSTIAVSRSQHSRVTLSRRAMAAAAGEPGLRPRPTAPDTRQRPQADTSPAPSRSARSGRTALLRASDLSGPGRGGSMSAAPFAAQPLPLRGEAWRLGRADSATPRVPGSSCSLVRATFPVVTAPPIVAGGHRTTPPRTPAESGPPRHETPVGPQPSPRLQSCRRAKRSARKSTKRRTLADRCRRLG